MHKIETIEFDSDFIASIARDIKNAKQL